MSIIEIKRKITPVLKEYGVTQASVFSSVARSQETEESDVDLLVRVDNLPFGIWGFDEVRVYNRALFAAEIQRLYQLGK